MKRTTTRKAMTAMAMAAAAMLMTTTWSADEVMFVDAPQAGQTGMLMAKAAAQPKSGISDIDSRGGSGGSGTGQDGATPVITVMDGVQLDGGSWFCKALASTGLDEIVDVSLLCD